MSALSIGTELASVPFDQMIRNLLLAMVEAQNDANTSFIKGVQDLVETPVNLSYTKAGDSSSTKTTISRQRISLRHPPHTTPSAKWNHPNQNGYHDAEVNRSRSKDECQRRMGILLSHSRRKILKQILLLS